MFHPAVSVDYQVRRKARTRVHVEPHQFLDGYVVLKLVDAVAEAVLELTLSPLDAQQLVDQVDAVVAATSLSPDTFTQVFEST